jgi:hypothetical protein
MEPNPYEAPKEPAGLTARSGLAIVGLLLLSIPAGCICGGITCFSTGVVGEESARVFGYEQNAVLRESGWIIGIPIGILVLVLVPVLAFRIGTRRRQGLVEK